MARRIDRSGRVQMTRLNWAPIIAEARVIVESYDTLHAAPAVLSAGGAAADPAPAGPPRHRNCRSRVAVCRGSAAGRRCSNC